MATITGLTAARMLAIEAASVIDGDIVGDDLILTRQSGATINAGNVRGPQGDPGPAGSNLAVVTAQDILAVGVSGQIRAGRQLTATDFTDMGLSAPIGLWNLSNVNDSSGNGRNLTNKGSVAFVPGIGGAATTAAQFTGSGTKVLYIADTGAADPFRIKTGSIGCWFRVSRRNDYQALLSKRSVADGNWSWWLQIHSGNSLSVEVTTAGTNATKVSVFGVASVTDDKWHFGVATFDGAFLKLYLDGRLDQELTMGGLVFGGTGPLNIGGFNGDAGNNATYPTYGRIDEAFVLKDVLSEDQVRNLYCTKIAHSLAAVPKAVALNVTRRQKGAALVVGDFSATPLRLYNFSGGALTDAGSNNATLTAVGTPSNAPGVDGIDGNAKNFDGVDDQFTATDTGLPSGSNARTFGCWFKAGVVSSSPALISWGSSGTTTSTQALWLNGAGSIVARDQAGTDITAGIFSCDGRWHFAVVSEDPSAADGYLRKLYLDGECVGQTTALNVITLSGANRFRLGQWADGAGTGALFKGQMDSAFVCNYGMTPEEIQKLYNKGSIALGVSPKNAGDHVELMTSSNLYCIFDTLEGQNQVSLAVA